MEDYPHLECPEKVKNALRAIALVLHGCTGANPFENTGQKYDGECFSVEAYSWDEREAQFWNFKWRDIRVSWYKYLLRGTQINREMEDEEIKEMIKECVCEICLEEQHEDQIEQKD
jgi:hypothetical protein